MNRSKRSRLQCCLRVHFSYSIVDYYSVIIPFFIFLFILETTVPYYARVIFIFLFILETTVPYLCQGLLYIPIYSGDHCTILCQGLLYIPLYSGDHCTILCQGLLYIPLYSGDHCVILCLGLYYEYQEYPQDQFNNVLVDDQSGILKLPNVPSDDKVKY